MYNNIYSVPIDAPEEDYLYSERSQIPNAGMGLFTAIKIFKSEVIAIFAGEIISEEEQKIRAEKNEDAYFINLLDGKVMDSMHTFCFAKFANDAEGFGSSAFKNNAIISLNEHDQVCLIASKNIPAFAEVFCGYGEGYWRMRSA
jgi:hypothetical protein